MFHVKPISHETLPMPKKFTSKSQKTGEIGENIAAKFLVKRGFSIIDRNYTRKWGEIDIICTKRNKLYFIEVKSVSKPSLASVTKDALDQYHPEDNMHPWKQKRVSRTIQTYLLSQKVPDETEWEVDLMVVFMDMASKKARIKMIEDIIL